MSLKAQEQDSASLNYNAHEMLSTIRYAEHIYYDKKREWNKMIDRAMAADFSGRFLLKNIRRCTTGYALTLYKFMA